MFVIPAVSESNPVAGRLFPTTESRPVTGCLMKVSSERPIGRFSSDTFIDRSVSGLHR